jgi:head-tail adaptor
MSTPADWLRIQQSLTAIRDMNAVSLVLRRGATTLAAQSFRVERKGNQSAQRGSAGAEQAETAVALLGAVTANIQAQDRFTLAGALYEVTLVHPNRLAGTQADAKVIE